jgi:hypothetical protein
MSEPEVKLIDSGKRIQITIDIENPPRVSKSGKCVLLASAMIKTGIEVDGQPVKVGVNVMAKRGAK